MRLDMVDAIDSAADKITGTVRVRELWQPRSENLARSMIAISYRTDEALLSPSGYGNQTKGTR